MPQTRSLARSIAYAPLVLVFMAAGCTYVPYSPPPLAFSGDSSSADRTIVVATLDSPAPKGKNVIWCATFQACWTELKAVVGPMDVLGAQETVRRLNEARMNPDDLPESGYYAAAGLVKDGIVEKIKSEMAVRFPKVTPNLPSNSYEAVAYAYLNDAVKFRTGYFDRDRGDDFIDSSGNRSRISSFGLYKTRESSVNTTLARQIEVLYSDKKEYPRQEFKFVLDLDKNSRPTQLILACVEPKESLAATWQEVQRKMREWKPSKDARQFGDHDSLAVPNVNYQLQHSFEELETSGLLGTSQAIRFRLDRSGAGLVSEAYFFFAAGGRHFSFTRPFLIALRKRGSAEPYFVMWVDNAELLCKQITN